jgi:hypothetical protein
MGKKQKGGFPWVGVGLGVAALGLFGLATHAKAASTPLEPYEDPNLSQKEQAKAMSDTLKAMLDAKGFDTFDTYVTAKSKTSGIRDRAGVRDLVKENQAGYESYYHFMWTTNSILTFNNFGQAGIPWDNSPAVTWPEYIQQYQAAKAYIASL